MEFDGRLLFYVFLLLSFQVPHIAANFGNEQCNSICLLKLAPTSQSLYPRYSIDIFYRKYDMGSNYHINIICWNCWNCCCLVKIVNYTAIPPSSPSLPDTPPAFPMTPSPSSLICTPMPLPRLPHVSIEDEEEPISKRTRSATKKKLGYKEEETEL